MQPSSVLPAHRSALIGALHPGTEALLEIPAPIHALDPGTDPSLVLKRLPDGPDPLPVYVEVCFPNSGGAAILHGARLVRWEPKLDIIDEPKRRASELCIEVVTCLGDDFRGELVWRDGPHH